MPIKKKNLTAVQNVEQGKIGSILKVVKELK